MTVDELAWMPAWRLAEEIAAKRLSSVEVAKATLARINDLDDHLNSFLTVTPELALEQAHEAEQAVMRCDDLGPLHGVPVSIKDSLWTARRTHYLRLAAFRALRTDGGLGRRRTAPRRRHGPRRQDEHTRVLCVRPHRESAPGRMRQPVGSDAHPGCVEWRCGRERGGRAHPPRARDRRRWVGAPAGRAVRHRRAAADDWAHPELRHHRWHARVADRPDGTRTVRDNALLLAAISGPDARDSRSVPGPTPPFTASLETDVRGMRMGWTGDFGHLPIVEPAVIDTIRDAAFGFALMGAHVDELTEPPDDARPLIVILEQDDEFVALLHSFFDDPDKAALLSGFFFDPSNTGASPEGARPRDQELPEGTCRSGAHSARSWTPASTATTWCSARRSDASRPRSHPAGSGPCPWRNGSPTRTSRT